MESLTEKVLHKVTQKGELLYLCPAFHVGLDFRPELNLSYHRTFVFVKYVFHVPEGQAEYLYFADASHADCISFILSIRCNSEGIPAACFVGCTSF